MRSRLGLVSAARRACEPTRKSLRQARGERGSGLIEFALVLPVLFLVLFGIFAFSMAMASDLSATYSLRMAARYASVHSLTSVNPASTAYLSNLVNSSLFLPQGSSPTVSVSYVSFLGAASGNYVGNAIILTVAWSQSINVPLYSKVLPFTNQTYRMITQ
jgi:Flp pilus assembly protein TadG